MDDALLREAMLRLRPVAGKVIIGIRTALNSFSIL
jgi:hypothetical protein